MGGLEKEDKTGEVSYDPENHELMVKTRARKVALIAKSYPKTEILQGPTQGDLLVLGWGNTKGAIHVAVAQALAQGLSVAQLHLRYINPLPADLGAIISGFKKVLIPELNDGQLVRVIRDQYLVEAEVLDKIQGKPFLAEEILQAIKNMI